jgi:hypothetical protein
MIMSEIEGMERFLYYVYPCSPIDYWGGSTPILQDSLLNHSILISKLCELDFMQTKTGVEQITNVAFCSIPNFNNFGFSYITLVKLEHKGTTIVISPIKLDFLEKHLMIGDKAYELSVLEEVQLKGEQP